MRPATTRVRRFPDLPSITPPFGETVRQRWERIFGDAVARAVEGGAFDAPSERSAILGAQERAEDQFDLGPLEIAFDHWSPATSAWGDLLWNRAEQIRGRL